MRTVLSNTHNLHCKEISSKTYLYSLKISTTTTTLKVSSRGIIPDKSVLFDAIFLFCIHTIEQLPPPLPILCFEKFVRMKFSKTAYPREIIEKYVTQLLNALFLLEKFQDAIRRRAATEYVLHPMLSMLLRSGIQSMYVTCVIY